MSDASSGYGKFAVNRCMSLDGFIAAAGHVMDWGRRPPARRLRRARRFPGHRRGHRRHARSAAGAKDLEILGADVAAQCLQRGLVDEILVYVLPVLLGDGVRFSPPGLPRIDLEPISATWSRSVTILRFRVRK